MATWRRLRDGVPAVTIAPPLKSIYVTSHFGPRGAVRLPDGTVKPPGHHNGTDLRAADGTLVTSPINGVVDDISYSPSGALQMFLVGEGWRVALVHLDDILEPPGAVVRRGEPVALSGHSGGVAPHLHLELRRFPSMTLVDPMLFMSSTSLTPTPKKKSSGLFFLFAALAAGAALSRSRNGNR